MFIQMLPIFYHDEYDAQTVPDGHRFPMRKYSLVAERLSAVGRSFHVPEMPAWCPMAPA